MNCRQWVVDAEPWDADALTLEAGDRSEVTGNCSNKIRDL